MKAERGTMTPEERLQVVFYLVMRDDLPAGKLLKHIKEVEHLAEKGLAPDFTAKPLAEYAAQLVKRVMEGAVP